MAKQEDLLIQIPIERFSPKGFGVGYFQKTPIAPRSKVEVPAAIVGDLAEVRIGKKRKGAYAGRLAEVIRPSPDRVLAPCVHADSCGGCAWQALSYPKQLQEKQEHIQTLFALLISEKTKIDPILPSESIWQYRNKMEYTFSQNAAGDRFLGLMMAGTKGKVQTLSECHLTPPWFVSVLRIVYQWWENGELTAFHPFKNRGCLRTLTLREGKRTGDKMVLLTVSGHPEDAPKRADLDSFVEKIQEALGKNTSIFLRIQQAVKGSPTQFFEMHLAGPDHILEHLEIAAGSFKKTYSFKISPTAFFQPNPRQAEKMYSRALELVGFDKKKSIWDLYAGTATLGVLFAPLAEEVISIELNPHAVFDARVNQEVNGVEHLKVYQGDVAEVLKEKAPQTNPDLVVLDPPRTGLSDDAVFLVLTYAPKEILYISCHPLTQARDCFKFCAQGYEVLHIQPVDQFPHTVHVENMVLLRKKQ